MEGFSPSMGFKGSKTFNEFSGLDFCILHIILLKEEKQHNRELEKGIR